MEKALRLILRVEASAKDVMAEAETAVNDLECYVDEETMKLREATLSVAQKRVEEIKSRAQGEADKREKDILAATQREVDLLMQKAEAHMDEAAQLVVNAVLGSGTSK